MPPWATTLARLHQHDVRGEPQHLIELVTDIDHRDRQPIAQRFEVGQHFLAPFAGRARPRARPAAAGAAAIAAHGRSRRAGARRPRAGACAARIKRAEIEQASHLIEAHVASARARRSAILEIGGDAQVRKQPRVLEYVTDAAPLGRRHRCRRSRVEQHVILEHHSPASGVSSPAMILTVGALAAAGRSEQRDDARCRQLEADVEREGAAAAC